MHISVIICTWNRCRLLRRTLESVCALTIPTNHLWEVIVVNNNCTDATDAVLAEFATRLPLRRVFEPGLGVSRARNTAAKAAAGDLLLYTDDDVRLAPHWLSAYAEAAEMWPNAWYFGGPITPWFASRPPLWARAPYGFVDGMLVQLDLGPLSRGFQTEEYPFGPNMAFRRGVFERAWFIEYVGRKGTEQIRDSEISLVHKLKQLGLPGMWVPRAQVEHFVPQSRATLKYLWSYCFGKGRAAVRLYSRPNDLSHECPSPALRAQLSPAFRDGIRLLSQSGKGVAKLLLGREDWVGNWIFVAYQCGQIYEARCAASPAPATERENFR